MSCAFASTAFCQAAMAPIQTSVVRSARNSLPSCNSSFGARENEPSSKSTALPSLADAIRESDSKLCEHMPHAGLMIAANRPSELMVASALRLPASELSSCLTKRKNLKHEQRSILLQWFESNIIDPYPTQEQKERLARLTKMSVRQIEHCACLLWNLCLLHYAII